MTEQGIEIGWQGKLTTLRKNAGKRPGAVVSDIIRWIGPAAIGLAVILLLEGPLWTIIGSTILVVGLSVPWLRKWYYFNKNDLIQPEFIEISNIQEMTVAGGTVPENDPHSAQAFPSIHIKVSKGEQGNSVQMLFNHITKITDEEQRKIYNTMDTVERFCNENNIDVERRNMDDFN